MCVSVIVTGHKMPLTIPRYTRLSGSPCSDPPEHSICIKDGASKSHEADLLGRNADVEMVVVELLMRRMVTTVDGGITNVGVP